MSYYLRVFCKSDHKPNIKEAIAHINGLGHAFKVSVNLSEEDQTSGKWTDVELTYKAGKMPILIECNQIGDEDDIAREEIEEFVENIVPYGKFKEKDKIIAHLNATRYIILSQLPLKDLDEDGYTTNKEFLKYVADYHQGIIHEEQEGFYDGKQVY